MLEGDRVTLRPLQRDDIEFMTTMANDLELELLGGGDPPRPTTIESFYKWFDDTLAKDVMESADLLKRVGCENNFGATGCMSIRCIWVSCDPNGNSHET